MAWTIAGILLGVAGVGATLWFGLRRQRQTQRQETPHAIQTQTQSGGGTQKQSQTVKD